MIHRAPRSPGLQMDLQGLSRVPPMTSIFSFLFLFWCGGREGVQQVAGGLLVSRPGIEPGATARKALDHQGIPSHVFSTTSTKLSTPGLHLSFKSPEAGFPAHKQATYQKSVLHTNCPVRQETQGLQLPRERANPSSVPLEQHHHTATLIGSSEASDSAPGNPRT